MVEVHFHADIDSYGTDTVIADGIIERLPESYSMHILSTDDEGLVVLETLISDEALESAAADDLADDLAEVYEAFLEAFEKTLAEVYKESGNLNAETEASEAREAVYCWLQLVETDD